MGLFSKAPPKQIVKVKYLGVRTMAETKVVATYRSSLFCFLVEYDDKTREILEYESGDKKLPDILQYIDMD